MAFGEANIERFISLSLTEGADRLRTCPHRKETIMQTNIVTRNSTFTFNCCSEFKLGAYSLQEGEAVKAVSDGQGLFYVYVGWGDGPIAKLNARDVNKLAGYKVIAD